MGFLSRRKSVRSTNAHDPASSFASHSLSLPSSPPPPLPPQLQLQAQASAAHARARSLPAIATYPYSYAYPNTGVSLSARSQQAIGQQGTMPTVPLVPLAYPAQPQQMQYIPYVPYANPAGARSPPLLSPPPSRPAMSRAGSGSGKLHSPRADRERERQRTRSMSRAYAYAAASPPPVTPISPIPLVPVRPHPAVQVNVVRSPPHTALPTPAATPIAPAAANPASPVYYPPITRFCPHCNARQPTAHHFQFCSSCQRPLQAYPQRPPSVVPDADGFAIPGIGGQVAVNLAGLSGRRTYGSPQASGSGTPIAVGQPVPTHKMSITEPPESATSVSASSAVGSPIYSSPGSSPIGSVVGGPTGAVGPGDGPGSTHPAGREALVLPNGSPTRKLEALRDALVDFLFKQVPTSSGLVDMSRTYFLEWAWGRADFLTLFNGDTTQRLYNALEYEYATVVTQHPSNASVVERTPALSRKGLLQFLTHEILLDPHSASQRLKRLLAAYRAQISPPPAELGVGDRWRVEEYMMLRAPHPIAVQRQKRLVQTMRGLGWELSSPAVSP